MIPEDNTPQENTEKKNNKSGSRKIKKLRGERKILFGNFLKVQGILSLVFTMELRTGLELVR